MDKDDMNQNSIFIDASDALRHTLDETSTSIRLNKGEALFEQGDFDDRLYVLDEGTLEVCVYSAAGRRLALNRLPKGSVFGEIALFDPGPRTARVDAVEPCKLRVIRQSSVLSALANKPNLAAELLRLAGKRMRWLSAQMENQVFLSPSSRLAEKLLYLVGDGDEVKMSQAQLADHVGVSRELVSKTLSEWRREGLIELSRGRIGIRDGETLEELKDFDFI